jgi:hypothetical protein
MKQPKKLSRTHKEILSKRKLNPKEWMLVSDDKINFTIIHKISNETKVIEY